MTYVRGQAAYVEETIRSYLATQLGVLGWMGAAGTLPYGAQSPVVIIDYLPAATDPVADNTIAMTCGDEDDDTPQELGAASGGLFQTTRPYFIDIFGEGPGIALRIADDVKAIFTGKLAGTSRYQKVLDPVTGGGATLANHLLEFADVVRTKPQNVDYKRNWQVVKLTCNHQFDASENGTGT